MWQRQGDVASLIDLGLQIGLQALQVQVRLDLGLGLDIIEGQNSQGGYASG